MRNRVRIAQLSMNRGFLWVDTFCRFVISVNAVSGYQKNTKSRSKNQAGICCFANLDCKSTSFVRDRHGVRLNCTSPVSGALGKNCTPIRQDLPIFYNLLFCRHRASVVFTHVDFAHRSGGGPQCNRSRGINGWIPNRCRAAPKTDFGCAAR